MSARGESFPETREKLGIGVTLQVFIPFACGYFLSYVFRTVNSIIAPNLVADTGIDAAGLGLLTSAFFLAFAVAQLPLGMLLDRFGPRRVEAALLICAAAGCLLFAVGESAGVLTVGRALIGFGASACLMAGFKAFVLWFPTTRLPLMNGLLLAVGGSGALVATAPVEWLLNFVDWRLLFVAMGLATLAVAGALVTVVPAHRAPVEHASLREQLAGLRLVFRDRLFWRLAPPALAAQGTFLAVQGLWAGPWLRDVGGFDRAGVALHLLALSMAMIVGFLVGGAIVERLARRGIAPARVAVTGMGMFVLVQVGLLLAPPGLALVVWTAFGLFGTAGSLSYAALSQHFHGRLSGRANTALNLLVFVSAFAVQWGLGMLLQYWENPVTHTYGVTGYRWGFLALVALQAGGLAWYFVAGKQR